MKYKNELGIFGNIKRIYSEATKTNNTVSNNKARSDAFEMQVQADIVESVIDEYEALVESEE